jgi:hypothetical protein
MAVESGSCLHIAGTLDSGDPHFFHLPAVLQVVQEGVHHPSRVPQLLANGEDQSLQRYRFFYLFDQLQHFEDALLQTLLNGPLVDLNEADRLESVDLDGFLQIDSPWRLDL